MGPGPAQILWISSFVNSKKDGGNATVFCPNVDVISEKKGLRSSICSFLSVISMGPLKPMGPLLGLLKPTGPMMGPPEAHGPPKL